MLTVLSAWMIFISETFKRNYPEIENEVTVLPHGYDPDDFDLESEPSKFNYQHKKLNILYSGLFYEQNQPDVFFRAIYELSDETSSFKDMFHLHFQGGIDKRIHALINKLGLTNNISDYGYVSHKIAVKNLSKADVLWMVSNFNPSLQQIKSGKIFEYMGSRKPILALVHASETSKLLENYQAGFSAPPNSIELIKERLNEIYTLWKQGNLPRANKEFISIFNRKTLTKKLAQIFDEISL